MIACTGRDGWRSDDVGPLVEQYGGPVSGALLDPFSNLFRADGILGAVGYRAVFGSAVAIGDPVCAPEDQMKLAAAFRRFCAAGGRHTVYAAATARFAEQAIQAGMAALEWGEEMILDPARDPQAGSAGRELRKKVNKAQKSGVSVVEYQRHRDVVPELDRALESVANSWLSARRGPQVYIARVNLFSAPSTRRWWYARVGDRPDQIVGVLAVVHLAARHGYLVEHLLATPDAPGGVTEMLVARAVATLGEERCREMTFGPLPATALGRVAGFGRLSERVARTIFKTAGRVFHLDRRTRYLKKFQVTRTDPSYLLFDPPGLTVMDVVGLFRAFNVSLAT